MASYSQRWYDLDQFVTICFNEDMDLLYPGTDYLDCGKNAVLDFFRTQPKEQIRQVHKELTEFLAEAKAEVEWKSQDGLAPAPKILETLTEAKVEAELAEAMYAMGCAWNFSPWWPWLESIREQFDSFLTPPARHVDPPPPPNRPPSPPPRPSYSPPPPRQSQSSAGWFAFGAILLIVAMFSWIANNKTTPSIPIQTGQSQQPSSPAKQLDNTLALMPVLEKRFDGWTRAVAISPIGNEFAVAVSHLPDGRNTIQFVSIPTGDIRSSVEVDATFGEVAHLGYSADGQRLLVGMSSDLWLLDTGSGAILSRSKSNSVWAGLPAISPDGHFIAGLESWYASDNPQRYLLRVLDSESGNEVARRSTTLPEAGARASVLFATDGTSLLTNDGQSIIKCSVRKLDDCIPIASGSSVIAGNGDALFAYDRSNPGQKPDLRNDDGMYFANVTGASRVHISAHTWGDRDIVKGSMTLSGEILAALIRQWGSRNFGTGTGIGYSVQLWQISPLRQLAEIRGANDRSPEGVALSRDGKLLAVATALLPNRDSGGEVILYALPNSSIQTQSTSLSERCKTIEKAQSAGISINSQQAANCSNQITSSSLLSSADNALKAPDSIVSVVTPPPPTKSAVPQAPPDHPIPFPMGFANITAGEFTMGCPDGSLCLDEERPTHRVRITKNFEIGRYEVTQTQWQSVMGTNPSTFKDGSATSPVENVSWNDVQVFLGRLNARRDGYLYRLPTEAEWEYSARAGTTGAYAGSLDQIAWYRQDSGSQTHPVGQKQPNAWGLYDMLGNVWEWVQDWYEGSYYRVSPQSDPTGPSNGEYKLSRGGSWNQPAEVIRSSYRAGSLPDSKSPYTGFRCVREAAR